MEDIEQFKELFGPLALSYNEAQLRQLQSEMYAMAELLLDLYTAKRKGESRKRQAPRFDTQESRS